MENFEEGTLRVLFFGDIFAKTGVEAVKNLLPSLKEQYKPHVVCANGENATGGRGINVERYTLLRSYGIDVITTGNHAFAQKDIIPLFHDPLEPILVPANYPCVEPICSYFTLEIFGISCTIINLIGRTYMQALVHCPFRTFDTIVEYLPEETIVLVDFHAEATSEKRALAYYVDGRVSALLGTHTHVQTSDACILPGGTAFITDVGMCGARDSILGMDKKNVMHRFIQGYSGSFVPAKGRASVAAVLVSIDVQTRCACSIESIYCTVA